MRSSSRKTNLRSWILTNDSKKEAYTQKGAPARRVSGVLGVGLVSAASAIAGGLAVAWWYRKTLVKLQNPIVSGHLHKSEVPYPEKQELPMEESERPS
jgi:hypothetical protein